MFTALETLKLKGVKISKEEEKSAMLAILLHDVGTISFFSRFRKSFDGRLASRENFNSINEQN
jgi:HD superfamily phosphohydrolase